MLIYIEGGGKTGKTYMLSQLEGPDGLKPDVYKFPYVDYFREFLQRYAGDTGHNSREAHHFTTGYDVALLSLNKTGRLHHLLVDRGFISNIVFSLVEGRTTEEEGFHYIDWLDEQGFLANISIIYLRRTHKDAAPERNKDEWEFLHRGDGYEQQDELYKKFVDYTASKGVAVYEVKNNFDKESIIKFEDVYDSIVSGWISPENLPPLAANNSWIIELTDGRKFSAFYDVASNSFVIPTSNGLRHYTSKEILRVKKIK